MPPSHPHAALVIVGHGSTLNPDSSAPTHLHADTLRRRGLFREVLCCFWKEEPSMREIYQAVDSRVIYIVPNFISEGYFCQQVLPRELQLTGPVTELHGRTVHYCDPVGVHPNMTRLLLQRADEVAPGVPRDQTSLIIVGHGTNLNDNSTKAIQDQVRLIRDGGHGFAEVIDTYMEEAPFVADWHKLTTAPNVVVVPFFIADGLHSYQDIPVLLGMAAEPGKALSQDDVFRHNPVPLQGRSLYYSSAIGTEPLLADVILDQIADFDRRHGIVPAAWPPPPEHQQQLALARWMVQGRKTLGQIRIHARPDRRFLLTHLDDAGSVETGALTPHTGPETARELARYDDAGEFRPLKTAPTLRRGWQLELTGLPDLHLALEFFYPAQLGMALTHGTRDLVPVPLRDLLGRQTGMYRFTNTITDEQACDLIAAQCHTGANCLRRILYPLSSTQPFTGAAADKLTPEAGQVPGVSPDTSIPLLCMESCTHIVSAARKIAQQNHAAREKEKNKDSGSPAS